MNDKQGLGARMAEAWRKNWFFLMFLTPATLSVGVFVVIVAASLIVYSLTGYAGGTAGDFPTVANYAKLVSDPIIRPEFFAALWRTIWYVGLSTPLQLLTGLGAALLINRAFSGRGVVRSILLLPLAIPTIVTTSIILILFSKGSHVSSLLLGEYPFFPALMDNEISFINNEYLALGLSILGKVWRDTPISMLIILAGLQTIDDDQYEAATTMGASVAERFIYITLPLLIPAITTVLVLRSIEAWKEFIFPYILAPAYPILGVLIDKYFVQMRDPGLSAIVAIVMIALILATAWLLGKFLKKLNAYIIS